jgi:hypothetical protein
LLNNNTKDPLKIKPRRTNNNTKTINIPNKCTTKPKNTNIKPNTHKTQRLRKRQTTIPIHTTTNKKSIKHIITLMPLNINPYFINTPKDQPTTQQRNSKDKQKVHPNPKNKKP